VKVEGGVKDHGQPAGRRRFGGSATAEAGFGSQLGCSVADWLWGVLWSLRTHAGGALSFRSE
jgi:hypothetical protein